MRTAKGNSTRDRKNSDPWWIAWAVGGTVFPALLYWVAMQKPETGTPPLPAASPTGGLVTIPTVEASTNDTAAIPAQPPSPTTPSIAPTPAALVGPAPERGPQLYIVTEDGREALFSPGAGATGDTAGWKILPPAPSAKVNAVATWSGRRWRVGTGVEWSEEAEWEAYLRRERPDIDRITPLSKHFEGGSTGLTPAPHSAIHCDRRNRIWVASWAGGIARLETYRADGGPSFSRLIDAPLKSSPEPAETDRWIPTTTAEGLCHDNVNGFAEDARGRLWVATDLGVSILEHDRVVSDPSIARFAQLNVKSITNDREGRVFLGAIGGLVIVHPNGSISVIDPSSGLPQRTPQAVFVDSRHRIWAGTWGGGAVQIDRITFHITPELALPGAGLVCRMCEDSSGSLWLASLTNGLWKLEGGQWTNVPSPPGFESIRLVASVTEAGY